jgi:hypothetical protein
MLISHTTFSGGVTNAGTIGPGGISVVSAAFLSGGGILDSGIVSGGIKVDASSKIVASGGIHTAIAVENTTTFGGGISNAGLISAVNHGVLVQGVSTFTGGVTNSGRIASKSGFGIFVSSAGVFGNSNAGGIRNGGTISGHGGINVDQVAVFVGGITNAGTISAHITDVFLRATAFSGGVVNSGTLISDNGDAAIYVITSTFSGNVVNKGKISAQLDAVIASSFAAFGRPAPAASPMPAPFQRAIPVFMF